VLHHHHDREGRLINNLKWQTLREQTDYCVLAQYGRATETIRAVWHGEGSRYDFAVMILGGKHHGVIIQCSTERSVMWLFDMVRIARKTGREWNWLAPLDVLDGWHP
jgi:hypothetical protein